MNKYKIRNQLIGIMPDAFDFLYAIRYGLRAFRYRKCGWPVSPDYWVKRSMILREGIRIQARSFVETGTFLGDTTWFMRNHFSSIHSIELSENLATLAKNRFAKWGNIKIIQGDSSICLREIVSGIKSPALFWLDGHYSGGITALGKKECPVWDELHSIQSSNLRFSIMIDDAREFSRNPAYPQLEEIFSHVESSLPSHRCFVENDIVFIVQN